MQDVTLWRGAWDERIASGALRNGYCSESRRWVYPLGSFFLGAKCMRQPVPCIAVRHTITHNHSVIDDVHFVGTTEVPGLGTRETENDAKRPHCGIGLPMKRCSEMRNDLKRPYCGAGHPMKR